jgi:type IV pilus assembly protein PilM
MEFFSVLTKVLPPPRTLRMPAVALDVSDTSVKFLKLVESGDFSGYEIEHYGVVDLQPGAVVNGSLEKPEVLAEAIRSISKQTNCQFVRMSLPEEHAYIFETSLKRTTAPKAIRSAIELKLEENVPLPPREAVFDYDIEEDDLNHTHIRVVVTAYARSMVDKYFEACERAGVVPVAFEVEAEALARSVVPLSEEGAQLVIDLGETRAGIGIVQNNALRYTSTIEVGSGEIFSRLQEADPALDEAAFKKILNSEGLSVKGVGYEHILITVSKIVDELQLRLQYWDNQITEKQKPKITKIILCGGGANIKGLARYCESVLGVSVELANVWQNAFSLEDYVPTVPMGQSLGFATAIGLALGDHLT